MAAPVPQPGPDHVATGQSFVRLSGLTMWQPANQNTGIINTVTEMALNYESIAASIAAVYRPAANPAGIPAIEALNEFRALREVLKYFYYGANTMSGVLNAAAPQGNAATRNGFIQARNNLTNALNQFTPSLANCYPLPANLAAFPAGNFDVPNRPVMELFLRFHYEALPVANRPATLDAFQQMAQALVFRRTTAQRGFPFVTFTCMSHANQLNVGTNNDAWNGFPVLDSAVKTWRSNRFPGLQANLRAAGDVILNAFNAEFAVVQAANAGFSANNFTVQQRTALETGVTNRLTGPPPDPAYNPYLNPAHGARSWMTLGTFNAAAAGGAGAWGPTFEAMARCWKCHFLHQYDTTARDVNNGGPLPVEGWMPTLTCNVPLACAEDVCEWYCHQPNGNPAFVWPPQPAAAAPP